MVRTVTLEICFITILIMVAGCTDITEYEMGFSAGLHAISSEDFSILHVVSDLPGAQTLLMYPEKVFVVSNEGYIYSYNPEDMELIEEIQVGAPSPAGYSDIVFCSLKNSAYLIGALGTILEINLPECNVVDEFSLCQSPIMLELGLGSSNLFVADGPTNRIYQMSVIENIPHDDISFFYTVKNMASCQNPDSMLVSTSGNMFLLEVISPVYIRRAIFQEAPTLSDMIAVPDDTIFVAVKSNNQVGILDMFSDELVPSPAFTGAASITGSNHILAMGNDWQHAYVLSYLGDDISRLCAFNYRFLAITQTVDIAGFPLDLEVSGGGTIYALTTH